MSKTQLNSEKLRETILRMAGDGTAGHIGCAFSLVEIVQSLYSDILNFNPENPRDENRDYLCLSKGHGVMALYAAFYDLGWINEDDITNYFKDNSKLFGLCEDHIPGIEVSGGSLGHGLPVATGMALGLMRKKSKQHIYCIVGDGELNEGSMWEAILFAGHHKLNNLTIIVDLNRYQAMGKTEDIIELEPLDKKFESFGFKTSICDGHLSDEISSNLKELKNSDRPSVLIAKTIKGKGVSFMEGENLWHYKKMNEQEEVNAFNEVKGSN